MLTSGDVVDLYLGNPSGREAGFRHPAVIVTAQRILDNAPNVVHVVPLTTTTRDFASEIVLDADVSNGLDRESSAQCQHLRSVSTNRIQAARGNVGPMALTQIRDMVGLILDIAH